MGTMMTKQKFYVVWKGRKPGIYGAWEDAAAQVNGFAGAQYKAFATKPEAEAAFRRGYAPRTGQRDARAQPAARWKQLRLLGIEPPRVPSYCADAACSGNPGRLEYRAVKTETGEILFARGPFAEGTNNIGEFLGIVETLMWLNEQKDASPVYSDSVNAISWVKQKECKTQLARNRRNAALFRRIADAERWLHNHPYPNLLLKWRTDDWGEIPADYGRK
jgi:ribonuclease HI